MDKTELRWEWVGQFERDNGRLPTIDEIPKELKHEVKHDNISLSDAFSDITKELGK